MKAFIKAVVIFPVVLGVVLGLLLKYVSGWEHTKLLSWILYLVLMIGVWFPYLLVPYLKRSRSRF